MPKCSTIIIPRTVYGRKLRKNVENVVESTFVDVATELAHIVQESLAHYRVLRPLRIFVRLSRLCGKIHIDSVFAHWGNLPTSTESIEPFDVFLLGNQVVLLADVENYAVANPFNFVFRNNVLFADGPRSVEQSVNEPLGIAFAADDVAALDIAHPNFGFAGIGKEGENVVGLAFQHHFARALAGALFIDRHPTLKHFNVAIFVFGNQRPLALVFGFRFDSERIIDKQNAD